MMAAYITFKLPKDNEESEGVWYHNSNIKFADVAKHVVSIQADGDELEHILLRFSGITTCTHARVQEWFGDTAKFIVRHLT